MKHWTLLLALVAFSTMMQAEDFRALVVDATSGKPLPYAVIEVPEVSRTLTNERGEFALSPKEGGTMRISAAGYSTRSISVAEANGKIELQPLTPLASEIDEKKLKKIMDKVAKQLGSEYRKHASATSTYRHRISVRLGEKEDVMEAMQTSESALNIGNTTYWGGRFCEKPSIGEKELSLSCRHMSELSELGPAIVEAERWEGLVRPFDIRITDGFDRTDVFYGSEYSGPPGPAHPIRKIEAGMDYRNFAFTGKQMQDERGDIIYRIDMKYMPLEPKETYRVEDDDVAYVVRKQPDAVLEGVAYVDARSRNLIAFSGELKFYIITWGKSASGSADAGVEIKATYSHKRKFTEVESLVCTAHSGSLTCKSILCNLPANTSPEGSAQTATNFWDSIKTVRAK